MFSITTDAIQGIITSAGNSIDSFLPIVALYVALPMIFYVVQRIKKMLS